MPASVVLERFPVPVLAVEDDGTILFANTAFADMVGREPGEVLALGFKAIFHEAPDPESSILSFVQSLANMVVKLAHADGSIVRALISRSAVMRAEDKFALAAFQDLTEQLWKEEH